MGKEDHITTPSYYHNIISLDVRGGIQFFSVNNSEQFLFIVVNGYIKKLFLFTVTKRFLFIVANGWLPTWKNAWSCQIPDWFCLDSD